MTNNPNEEWRPVGCCPYHEISNMGRLRGRGSAWRRDATLRPLKLTERKPNDYLATSMHGATHSVHVLVATAFIGPRPDGMQINHKDGNKTNNRADNLEYVTPKQNIHHALSMGLLHPCRGERNGVAKLTDAQVREIKASNEIAAVLAQRYRVSKSQIHSIRAGRSRRVA